MGVEIVSGSRADDAGLIALKDLTKAAGGIDHRVIGGHMVRLLTYVYSHTTATPRLTVDADAGISEPVAAAGELGRGLIALGYRGEIGNRYVRNLGGDQRAAIDLLVPASAEPDPQVLGGRAFDAAPGLRFAFACKPIRVEVRARLSTGDIVECAPLVPDLEPAVVLKLLATQRRAAAKDRADLQVMLEIVEAGLEPVTGPWRLSDPTATSNGERRDAARAAQALRKAPRTITPVRLKALLVRHVAAPGLL